MTESEDSSIILSDEVLTETDHETREISWGFPCSKCNCTLSELAAQFSRNKIDVSAFLEEYLKMRGTSDTDDKVFRFIRDCTGLSADLINSKWDRAEHKVLGGWFSPIGKVIGC